MPGAKRLKVHAAGGHRQSQHGFSYIEVLVATILLAVSLVPALEALRGGVFGASLHEAAADDHYRLTAHMEEVLAEPYSLLDAAAVAAGDATTPTDYSDPPSTAKRRMVYLSRYDADTASFTAADTGVLWVRVAYKEQPGELLTLTAR